MRVQNTETQNIREIQTMLRELSQEGAAIFLLTPDGIFGPETSRAVKDFQALYGLPVTGEVDSATWSRLVEVYRDIQHNKSKPSPIRVLPSRFMDVGLGDEGDEVYYIQIMLRTLAGYFSNILAAEISGKYDEATRRAVRQFQEAAGLPQSGRVDRDTWDRLTALYSVSREG